MNKDDVEKLTKLIAQIDGSYKELSVLSKKSPNDAINGFKLKIINDVISSCNKFLGKDKLPIEGFELFDADTLPSNSDGVFVLTQYDEAMEIWRASKLKVYGGRFHYQLDDETQIYTYPPRRR